MAVVHVHAALPSDAAGINVQRVALLDRVVDHGGQQVVGRADGVDVAGEVEIDVLHGYDLRIAAAGRAALNAEHRAEGRLAQAEHRFLAEGVHRVRQTNARRRLALARRRGADGGHQDELAFRFVAFGELVVDLGLVVAVGDDVLALQAQLGCDLGDRLHFGGLCNFDVAQHSNSLRFKTKWAAHTHTPVYAAQTVGLSSKLWCRVPRGKPHAIPSVGGLA